jgi:hypothetical protein
MVEQAKGKKAVELVKGVKLSYHYREYELLEAPVLDGEYYVALAKGSEGNSRYKIFWKQKAFEQFSSPYIYAVL